MLVNAFNIFLLSINRRSLGCAICSSHPASTEYLYTIRAMLDQRRRRWADVVQNYCYTNILCLLGSWMRCYLRFFLNLFLFIQVISTVIRKLKASVHQNWCPFNVGTAHLKSISYFSSEQLLLFCLRTTCTLSLQHWVFSGPTILETCGFSLYIFIFVKWEARDAWVSGQDVDDMDLWRCHAMMDRMKAPSSFPAGSMHNTYNAYSSYAVQSQKAVSTYFTSKQILPFSFAEQSCNAQPCQTR